ncbi:MAG: DUF349 domain-containing protein [Bacteroidales bacterium]|nr:DUF349 domain-containing protein [Bacteroidales bacterium]
MSEQTESKVYANRQEVIDRLAEIVNQTTDEVKSEINYLKLVYYKLRQQEVDAQLKAVLEDDAAAESYESKPDELEPRLKELLNVQKEARAVMVEARNREMAQNLLRKQEILKEMEAIAQDAENVGQQYNNYVELQKQFKEVGAVDAKEQNDLWSQYGKVNEQFYDALKINKELRDYDFRKNLERKTELCEEAEKLGEAADILAASRRLQEMHDEWKSIGPVAPEVREEIWVRFKAASSVVNKRHQEHFDAIRQQENDNEAAKTALCEKIEAIDVQALQTSKDWDTQTAAVLQMQADWRKIGFANKKVNTQIFERFRLSCDNFFKAKTAFYHSMHEEQDANLAKKEALCAKAEALKDSTEWRTTTDMLINMQKEWKTIGAIPHKQNNAVWERFRAACDYFFAAKEKAVGNEKNVELENMAKKQSVIDRLNALKEAEGVEPQQIRDLMAEWKQVGHVPFKEKDKLYNAYQQLVDYYFDKLDMKGQRARLENFREKVRSSAAEGNAPSERQKLQRQLERLRNDLKTYENNLGFLSAKSKSGNGMLSLMERKKQDLQAEIDEVIAKLNILDE